MAKPIKFRVKRKFKLVNRCIMCGKVIPMDYAICSSCNKKRNLYKQVILE